MLNLNSWFRSNKLSLNIEKSSFVIFRSPKKRVPNTPEHIEFLNFRIKRVSSMKFLGIILDEHLTWELQINEVCNKLKSMFHAFYNIRNFLSKENIKTIYYTLIYSRIKYGIAVYGQASITKMKRIQILQNRLLKVLADKVFRYSTDKLHDEFEMLKVTDVANQEILTFVFNYFNGNLPTIFQNYYVTFGEENGIFTRNSNNIIRNIRRNTNYGAYSIKARGSDLWNHLNNEIKTSYNSKQFRVKYKLSRFPYETIELNN